MVPGLVVVAAVSCFGVDSVSALNFVLGLSSILISSAIGSEVEEESLKSKLGLEEVGFDVTK